MGILTNFGTAIALVVSLTTAFIQFFPSGTTKVASTKWNASYDNGALTIGSATNFINTGNRPSIVSNVGLVSLESSIMSGNSRDCQRARGRLSDDRSWRTARYQGGDEKLATPMVIPAGTALSAYYVFSPLHYPEPERGYMVRLVCMEYEILDYVGHTYKVAQPIGTFRMEGNEVTISLDDDALAMIEIVP